MADGDDRDAARPDDGIVDGDGPFVVANEFTAVQVRKVRTRNGERLELVNRRTGARTVLDAMQLEVITLQRPQVFSSLLARTLAEQKASEHEGS